LWSQSDPAAEAPTQKPPARPSVIRTIRTEATTDQIAKWDSGGTLVDSGLYAVNGNLGIGISNPTQRLQITGAATHDLFASMGVDPAAGPAFNFGYGGTSFGRGAGFFNVRPDALADGPNPSLRFATTNTVRMIITNDGKVGIGYGTGIGSATTVPSEKLGVDGNIHATGNVTADGYLYAKFQDIAEWVPATSDLAPGTVVVLNRDRGNEVMASSEVYDTSVAGVVSAQPGLLLGVRTDGMEQIATTGRVKVRVDARSAPIHVGDLLVTSTVAGTAMRSEPMNIDGYTFHRPGTIVGKALESLDSGTGEILVLLSLQ
jgi:hypothetical protein